MNKNIAITLSLATMLTLGIANISSAQVGNSDTGNNKSQKEFFKKRGEHPHFDMQNVNHQVTNIENGVVIEITSTDADTVTKIKERENKEMPAKENVNVVKEELENGVRITITSDDADTVAKIQNRAENPGKKMKMFGKKRGHFKKEMGNFKKTEQVKNN